MMIFKSKAKLSAFFLSLLLFSLPAHAQTNDLQAGWVLSSLRENGKDVALEVQNPTKKVVVELELTKSSYGLKGSCNAINGKYTAQEDGKLKFLSIRSTLMACRDGRSQIENSLLNALSEATKYQIKDKILTIRDDTGTNVLIFNYQYPMHPALAKLYDLNWKVVTKCGLTFALPVDMKDLNPPEKKYTCVAGFANDSLNLTLENGSFPDDFKKTAQMLDYKEEPIQMGREKATLITYLDNEAPDIKKHVIRLRAELTTPELMINHLTLTITAKSEKDLETARGILETIVF